MTSTVEIDGVTRTIAWDGPVKEESRFQAVIWGRALDEVSAQPVSVTVLMAREGLKGYGGPDGLFGLVGVPSAAFTQRSTKTYTLDFQMAAEGFAPVDQTVSVTPATVLPITLGDLSLHRDPIRLTGQAMLLVDPPGAGGLPPGLFPLAATSLAIDAVAATVADAKPTAQELVALDAPISRFLAAGSACAKVAVSSGPLIRLRQPAWSDATVLALEDLSGLAVGTLVQIASGGDIIRLSSIDTDRRTVTLAEPLRSRCGQDTPVRKVTTAGAGAADAIATSAAPGDVTLFLSAPSALAGGDVVQLGAGPTVMFRRIERYRATSGPEGFFTFPPIHRVDRVALSVTHPSGYVVFQPGTVTPVPIITLRRLPATQAINLTLHTP